MIAKKTLFFRVSGMKYHIVEGESVDSLPEDIIEKLIDSGYVDRPQVVETKKQRRKDNGDTNQEGLHEGLQGITDNSAE